MNVSEARHLTALSAGERRPPRVSPSPNRRPSPHRGAYFVATPYPSVTNSDAVTPARGREMQTGRVWSFRFCRQSEETLETDKPNKPAETADPLESADTEETARVARSSPAPTHPARPRASGGTPSPPVSIWYLRPPYSPSEFPNSHPFLFP